MRYTAGPDFDLWFVGGVIMRVISVIVDWCPDIAADLERVKIVYPCWIEIRDFGQWICEVTITCRQEDVASIERVLAPYV